MEQIILCQLLAQRIPPDQFHLEGLTVVFNDPDRNNKPVNAPNESPYDTPENRAIVADVIANYDSLAAALVIEPPPDPLSDLIVTLINDGILSIVNLPVSIAAMPAVVAALKVKSP